VPGHRLIIRNGEVIDGSGAPAFRADVVVVDNNIEAVGDFSQAQADTFIDATGLTISPGFIDVHAHSDLTNFVCPAAESKLRQGVTLEVNGQCGYSPVPVVPGAEEELGALNPFVTAQPPWTWSTFDEFLDALQATQPTMNLAQMAGHSALRAWAMGFENRPAGPDEIDKLCAVTQQCIDQGAIGVSFGLAYALGSFAQYDEIEAICVVAARNNAHVSVHLRDEGERLIESLDEMIDIARRVSASQPLRLQIDHLKASGQRWWGKIDQALETIEAARDEGIDIAFDCYPYIAGSRHLSGSLPAWMHDGGAQAMVARLRDPTCRQKIRQTHEAWQRGEIGHSPFELSFERIVVTQVATETNQHAIGKDLARIAQERDQDPIEATLDLLAEEAGMVSVVLFSMNAQDMKKALAHPLGCIGTDGLVFAPYGPLSSGRPHPRSYGTYPRAIGRYARDEGIMSVEQAVRKCTSLPASRLGLTDRGMLREGMRADITVFDRNTIIDTATFEQPHQYPQGIAYVIVNGQVCLEGPTNHNLGGGEVIRRVPA